MIDRNSRTIFLFLCLFVFHPQISGEKTAEGDAKSQKLKSRDGKFFDFGFRSPVIHSVDTGAAYIPPNRNSNSSPFNRLPSAFVIDFQRPAVLDELEKLRADGMHSISNGLQDVASYVGGNIGYFLGAKGGFHITRFAGRLRGVSNGSNTGAIIGANVASAPFNAFRRPGQTNRIKNNGPPSYALDINTRRRPSHHNQRFV